MVRPGGSRERVRKGGRWGGSSTDERIEGWSKARDTGIEDVRADCIKQFLGAVVDDGADWLVESVHGKNAM